MNTTTTTTTSAATTTSTTASLACHTSRKRPAAVVGKRNTTNCSRYHPPQNDEMSTPANADDEVGNSHRGNVSYGGKMEPRLPTEHKNPAVEESIVQTDE